MTKKKVCPFLLRTVAGVIEILAFAHPYAGNQIVKGTLETGETALTAAKRELFEESGIELTKQPIQIGSSDNIVEGQVWYFFQCEAANLPDAWSFQTLDDEGHVFEFFWQPLFEDLTFEWHHQFKRSIQFIRLNHRLASPE